MSSLVYFRSAPPPPPHPKPHGPKRSRCQPSTHWETTNCPRLRSQISSNRILLKCSVQLFQVPLQKAAQHHYQSTQQWICKTTPGLPGSYSQSSLYCSWPGIISQTGLVWAKTPVLLSPLLARLQIFTGWYVCQRSVPSCK